MAQVLIRNLSDEIVETYKTKARLKGSSLEQEFRSLIEQHAPFTPEERAALVKENMARFPQPVPASTLNEIREGLS